MPKEEMKSARLLSVEGQGDWFEQAKKKLTLLALAETGGNKTHAAKVLGISIRTFRNNWRRWNMRDDVTGPFAGAANA